MKKLSQADFVARSNLKHRDKYDYSQSEYLGQDVKVKIICPIHGEFWQRPADHMAGKAQCPECGAIDRASNRKRWTPQRFLEEANRIHAGKFTYDMTRFTGMNGIVDVICPTHGVFEVKVVGHIWNGSDCRKCSGKAKRTTKDFVAEALSKHGDLYDYSKAIYINGHTPVEIICRRHGTFFQSPLNHARSGQRCPRCAAYGQSKCETQWLDSLDVPERQVRRDGLCFDGYDPLTNTVYEFHGDFWHGNPKLYKSAEINHVNGKSFGQLYQKTKQREDLILELGYNLVVMWESDFRSR